MSLQIVGVGSMAITLGLFLYDLLTQIKKKREKQKATKHFKTQQKLVKICLTGGPCGGKSSGINCIYNTFKTISAPFFVVPEAATIIGTSGLTLDLSKFSKAQIQCFQIYLMRLQYNLQEAVKSIAQGLGSHQKIPVILCDRGLLDGKAYAGPQNFSRMLKRLDITESRILQRYQAVIHMVTAAQGAQQFYEQGGVRKQDISFARELDQKIRQCYKRHPKRYIISNDFFVKNFQHKQVILLAQVNQIIQMIIEQKNLEQYYRVYQQNQRKNSAEELRSPNPYVIRKRKLQKFMNKKGMQILDAENSQGRDSPIMKPL